ncbi:DUF397 domain-containing protein [Saccharothrix coeruleofusca]|uniref:DUF397 domain-containing protein n=1 Tax=Saccharothrix coeruleofusca TaxID=33919 RepID=A0A918EBV2_9PSEU|nr:DUF397 domain-containing protein [Saccharothrix coeruleofusca]MBP2339941.1 hypothetical protein [Saccharothrix coeruleofusca]GGP38472.1 DUF397 domain-containing protein [Saccharothrix coeruleofusca]
MTEALLWRKSSYSGGANTDCVEVAPTTLGVVVRDSKNTSGPVLGFPAVNWRLFLTGLAR